MVVEEVAASPLAGGILQHGYQCGMIWGATLAAGKQAYLRVSPVARAEAQSVMAAHRLVDSFRTHNKHINCVDITELDKSSSSMQMVRFFLLKGGVVRCMRRAAAYASEALNEIESALAEPIGEVPRQPVSCAAMLARKMGATEMQAVMASGLAGGIGLCGGGCGALGAALWIIGLRTCEQEGGTVTFDNPELADKVEKFLEFTGYKFECAEIVGRKFRDLADHSAYLHDGGCTGLIDLLAAP
ncbi:C-GCAxxG-C-C family protein [bacterium]|nr:C-GCAxxG-C-C family protein [bacterium]